ncbi:MAG: hypothetical protein K2M67_09465 [Muribaculaceae bacterium]|nr:hypothetical protein [Muribaculaceae bacterium]
MKVNGHSLYKGVSGTLTYAVILMLLMTIITGCDRNSSAGKKSEQPETAEEYHADNDIAMVVRSIADAISVGEPLDSIDYDYEGVLTDGQGTPLYTDVQGAPGQWEVNVVSPDKAVIRNLYLGDLLPKDLESYVINTLALSPRDMVESDEFDADDESELALYEIPGGELRFETRAGLAPNGLEGPLLSIVILKKAS